MRFVQAGFFENETPNLFIFVLLALRLNHDAIEVSYDAITVSYDAIKVSFDAIKVSFDAIKVSYDAKSARINSFSLCQCYLM